MDHLGSAVLSWALTPSKVSLSLSCFVYGLTFKYQELFLCKTGKLMYVGSYAYMSQQFCVSYDCSKCFCGTVFCLLHVCMLSDIDADLVHIDLSIDKYCICEMYVCVCVCVCVCTHVWLFVCMYVCMS